MVRKETIMLSKKEQQLIARLQASGYVVNHKKMAARFKFMVGPLTTVGVKSLEIMSYLEDELF